MTQKKQPTSWRCRNTKQQKDKMEIYNSREWRELRIQKLRANPDWVLEAVCLSSCMAVAKIRGWRGE